MRRSRLDDARQGAQVHLRRQVGEIVNNAKMLRPELEQVDRFVDNIRYKSLTGKAGPDWEDIRTFIALAGRDARARDPLTAYLFARTNPRQKAGRTAAGRRQ
jgi:hypothetical protein